ncbi:mitochondrial inner membrane protein OXA1L-like, partial [Salvelinus namaycush]|uniref:Mitochondrial inner membrane protein OXA1L-like n=1 Tax=Salvelinus namaycush TaxID=8040 RepID=A0A8U0PV82_SALNM
RGRGCPSYRLEERSTGPAVRGEGEAVPPIGWKNAQLAQQLEERERRMKSHLDIASKGPLRQTFTHNPLQQSTPSITATTTATEAAKAKQTAPATGGKKRETMGGDY